MKRINFMFPKSLIERLKQAKLLTGIPVSEFIRRAIEKALQEVKL